MPRDKDFKRVVRTRAARTGESYTAARSQLRPATNPIRVAVVGAAGRVGYNAAFRIASGDVFDAVDLRLLEVPDARARLDALAMEIEDCSYPSLARVTATDDPRRALDGAQWVVLVGGPPRRAGMERRDLLAESARAFVAHGRSVAASCGGDVRVLVVANPSNTNCMVARLAAPDVPADRWFSLMRLDQNRARARLASQAGVGVADVTRVAIWGNHSATLYPDFRNALVGGRPAADVLDRAWLESEFVPFVQKRGAQLIEVGGASSAASAANAIAGTLRDLTSKTPDGDCVSVGVCSSGEYGVAEGLHCGFPVAVARSSWRVLDGFAHDAFALAAIKRTVDELIAERDEVARLLE